MDNELIVKTQPKSVISEDIRTLRTNIEFTLADYDDKVVMITSAGPSEGKSFISANLAVALAQNDKKVLLIDCDLRLGRLHKIFNITNKLGLSKLIVKFDEDIDYRDYIEKTDIKNLSLLPRGLVPPNPSELLASKRFATILSDLKVKYDYVIIDSVPTNGLPDALILSKIVTKTVIVSTYGKTDIDALEHSKKALENVNADIAGVIINKIPKSKNKYGSYYYYGER